LWNSLLDQWIFDTVIGAGNSFDFGIGGVDRFRILGIEPDAELDPTDPSAFVTGLTFTGPGEVQFTQTPITDEVPEPPALPLFAFGLLCVAALAEMDRRRN
jgi:hypothetical protein